MQIRVVRADDLGNYILCGLLPQSIPVLSCFQSPSLYVAIAATVFNGEGRVTVLRCRLA